MKAPITIKQYVSQMRRIPGGRFTMGRTYEMKDDQGLWKDELPSHPVDITSLRMGATHVTVGMWREYLRANSALSMPSPPDWGWIDSHPMINVSWDDIMGIDGKGGYCAWASRLAGVSLSLPSESQWEFAAKGGKDKKYPWGNDFDDSKVWVSFRTRRSGTAAVDRLNNIFVNKFGVSDLSGNVWEWCLDGYQPYIKPFDRLGYVSVPRDPVRGGDRKCARGSSGKFVGPLSFRCADRNMNGPDYRLDDLGFRLVAPA